MPFKIIYFYKVKLVNVINMKIATFSFLMNNKDYGSLDTTPMNENVKNRIKCSWGAYKCFLFCNGYPWITIGPHCDKLSKVYILGPLTILALILFSTLSILLDEHLELEPKMRIVSAVLSSI